MSSSGQPTSPRSPLSPSGSFHSPLRHHHRELSAHKQVKETRNAHAEYSNSEDDGTSQLKINQYLIQQEIGRGSFGAVHLARDQFDKEYAVKEFSKTRLRRRAKSNLLRRPRTSRPGPGGGNYPGPEGSEGVFKRHANLHSPVSSVDEENSFELIREEIAVMKKLNHPNLVSLIEVLDDPGDDSLFMVLEMCKKGVIMKVEVDDGADPYPEEQCRLWFRDLILGIEFLHAQGVVHRDIKPDNCLLTDDDTLKISDFGVSEMFEKTTEMRIAKSAGSPAFMAPELCTVQRGGVLGTATDIWSMGVTLYCLRFGMVPFRQGAVLDLYESIRNDPVEIPSETSRDLTNLMIRILEKDPSQRIKMSELREHPWVTRNGDDPLLPAEENCAVIVEPPTEFEMQAAITSNMGRIMAVMKAVNKFKVLLARRRPDLAHGILGSAHRMVRPPMQYDQADRRGSPGLQRTVIKEPGMKPSREAADPAAIPGPSDVSAEMNRLPRRFQTAVVTETTDADASLQPLENPSELRKTQTSPYPMESSERAKGHAHDPLEDHLYLNIGANPQSLDGGSDENEFLSESPQAAGYNVFETAYNEEVENIMQRRRAQTTVFLTRRVENQTSAKLAIAKANAGLETLQTRGAEAARSGFASLVGRAMGSQTPMVARAANAANDWAKGGKQETGSPDEGAGRPQ